MRHWRTTLAGIGSILAALADVVQSLSNGQAPHYTNDLGLVVTGAGLIFAGDAAVFKKFLAGGSP